MHTPDRTPRTSPPLTALLLLAASGWPASAHAQAAAPSTPAADVTPALRLEPMYVLGSRVRQISDAGPSPVQVYDREYIRASGALTLADFLNTLPMNYAGISAGRGSSPNELNPEFGQRTETTTPPFNLILGASAVQPAQTGVSGVSLRGLGSGSTLVLVDGRRVVQSGSGNRATDSRQGFVDLNTIPFGMIERIEISTDGASAIYGADAVAGVINIILKKDWVGTELTGSMRLAEDGGGTERSAGATTGFSAGNLRGTVNVSWFERDALRASDREFSANQDRRTTVVGTDANGNPVFGRDFRLLWGYPAVVQAQGGTVSGTFNAIPGVRVVLVPEGAATTPAVGEFIPVTTPAPGSTVVNASGQRRGNTAEFLDLIPESERYSVSGNFTYAFSERLELFGALSHSLTKGLFNAQAAVSSASASSGFGNFATVVPAAFNPFNQNVTVGMIHYEFGPTWQRTETVANSALIGLRGGIGDSWEWETGLSFQQQEFSQLGRLFNGARITSALNNPDPAQRLNPFVDARASGNINADLYEFMALYPTLDSNAESFTWDFSANGDLVDFWGGPIRGAFGGSYSQDSSDSRAVNFSVAVNPVVTTSATDASRDSYAAFAELAVPIFGEPNARQLLRRLDLQLAGRFEHYEEAGDTTVPRVGFAWSPFESLLLRGSYSEGFRAPALTEYQVANTTSTATVTDPRRTPTSTPGVTVTRGSRPSVEPETSVNEFLGAVLEVPFVDGLTVSANFYRTTQNDVIQVLSANTMLANETLFADRITRAAPDANDIALGQPGRVTAIDLTFVNFGEVRNESVDYSVDYTLPWEDLGRWRLNATATNTLASTRLLAPGQPEIVDDGDTFSPPEWRYSGSVFWSAGNWTASAFYTYIDGFNTNRGGNSFTANLPIDEAWKLDIRSSYEFRNGIYNGYGKGFRVAFGIANVTNEKPPVSDTVFGYNGGLHGAWALGRTYELSFILPF